VHSVTGLSSQVSDLERLRGRHVKIKVRI